MTFVVFPYHPDIEIIIKYTDLMNCKMLGLVSFAEDEHYVKEINSRLDTAEITNVDLMSKCDAVILLENYRGYRWDKYKNIIESAIKNNKTIYAESEIVFCKELFAYREKNLPIWSICEQLCEQYYEYTSVAMEVDMKPFEEPVITILGQGKNCGKFEMLLQFKKELKNTHRQVLYISSNELGVLFGFVLFPKIFFSDVLSFQYKIFALNDYIHRLLCTTKAELVVVSVPEGIAPFENGEHNHFGEFSLVVSNALKADFIILTVYMLEDVPENLVIYLRNFCSVEFGADVEAVVNSNNAFEVVQEPANKIIYDYLSVEYLSHYRKMVSAKTMRVVNLDDKYAMRNMIRETIAKLENNADTV